MHGVEWVTKTFMRTCKDVHGYACYHVKHELKVTVWGKALQRKHLVMVSKFKNCQRRGKCAFYVFGLTYLAIDGIIIYIYIYSRK